MNELLPEDYDQLPDFQKMQYQLAAHIRDPENAFYQADRDINGANAIEVRRLQIYEKLFFNNLFEFFSNQFPVLFQVLGAQRWQEITREYLQKHRSRTPLFHELGQEFLLFLQEEFEPIESDPPFLLEMAHYEWVELAVSIEPKEGIQNDLPLQASLDACYRLSPLAWPLIYEWPVNQISEAFQPQQKPELPTTLLVLRDEEGQVQFLALSPVLYEMIQMIAHEPESSVREHLQNLAEHIGQPVEMLEGFALEILEDLLAQNIIGPVA